MKTISAGAALSLACAAAAAAGTTEYPIRPLRVVVGLPAGGGADFIARTVSAKGAEIMGQPIVIDNRSGSAGRIAAETIANAQPDGYSFLFGSLSSAVTAPLLYRHLSYDPRRDFAPVTMLATLPNVLVVNVSVPARSVPEFIAYAKANPAKLTYASSGTGGILHLMMELLKSRTAIDVVHVPYKGGVQAIPDLLSGQIQAMFEILPTQLPYIRSGKTRALAVTTVKRSPLVPGVPTMEESGVNGFDVTMSYALFAPAKVPPAIIAKAARDFGKAVNAREVHERLAQQGIDAVATTPEELARVLEKEVVKWTTLIKQMGIAAND